MTAARYPDTGPLVIEQDVTFKRRIRLAVAGAPVVLTGATVRMHIRRSERTSTAYLSLESDVPFGETGITITNDGSAEDATYSEVYVYVADEDTADLTFGSAVMQFEVEFANGEKRRYLYCDDVRTSRDAIHD